MTGWQSGDGGQGNWNQPSFGPDPHTNQYGVDPYANQYGADPYANPYAANPYADPNAPNPYAADPYQQPYPPTGGFPAQQYPPTSGFPAQGYGPPPPPKRSKLPMILSLVAIVIIIGAVVTIVLVNRNGTQPVAQENPSTTSSSKTSKTSSPKSSGSSSQSPGEHEDWLTIDNTDDSGLSYQVPPDWQQSSTNRQTGRDVDFIGGADFGIYDCEGANYVRTFSASGAVKGKDGAALDMATTLEDFATSFGTTYWGADAKVDVPAPTETKVGDATAMTVTAKVTPVVTKPACQATEGEVVLIGVPLEEDGKQTAIAMVVVVNDLAGGPADPRTVSASVTQEILTTVKVGG